MKKQAVNTNEDLLEQVRYQDSSLPVSYTVDYFDDYINGEINYHWHDEVEFTIIVKGEVEYFINRACTGQKSCVLHEGDGAFVNTKALHMARQTHPGSVSAGCLFPSNFFTFQPASSIYKNNVLPIIQNPLPGLFLFSHKQVEKGILNTLQDFLNLDKNVIGYELMCLENVCKLWRLLLSLFTERATADIQKLDTLQEQRIRLMLSYIHTHYSENIMVDDIAKSANVSKSECFRCFKGIVKRTPVDYLLEYRLSRAAGLLANTEQTILHISLSCGFQNPSYFGKIFKQKCGFTPGQFRKQAHSRQACSYPATPTTGG